MTITYSRADCCRMVRCWQCAGKGTTGYCSIHNYDATWAPREVEWCMTHTGWPISALECSP